ncbi:MAG: hypothetical protein ACM3S1_13050 [Hyphomicrobiales bacterium]
MQTGLSAMLPAAMPPRFSSDPIVEAGRLLRRAARLPFEAARPRAWATQFTEAMVEARKALVAHILRAERSDSHMNEVYQGIPRLRSLVSRQTDEHQELLGRCHELVEDARILDEPGLWDMVEFSEKAKSLELAVGRHRERMLELVYEANNRQLGGEAG